MLAHSGWFVSGTYQEYRDGCSVADFVNGAAKEEVANETMAVAGHGDEIAVLIFGRLKDLLRRIPECQMCADGQAFVSQLRSGAIQIFTVGFHFLGFSQFEAIEVARDPAIGDVDKQQFGVQALCQFRYVRQQALVGRAIFKSDKDFAIHDSCFVISRGPQPNRSTRPKRVSRLLFSSDRKSALLFRPRLDW